MTSVTNPVDDPTAVARLRQEWSTRLARLADSFPAFSEQSEAVFLVTGDGLREVHSVIRVLTNMAGTVAERLSSAELTEVLQRLDDAVESIGTLRRDRGGLGTMLASLATATDGVLSALDALDDVMTYIRVLAVNAKIEAAPLESSGLDFSVFTREIARLSASGGQTIAAVRSEMTTLRAVVAASATSQQAFEHTSLTELDAVTARLTQSVGAVRDRKQRAAEAVQNFPRRLQGLATRTAEVVGALQIHDITRQRLEHVGQGLAAVVEVLKPDADPLDGLQLHVFVNGICELQGLQLAQTGEAYDEAVATIGRSLTAMAGEVPAIRALCEQVFSAADSGEGSFLLEVDRDLETAARIFTHFIAESEATGARLTHVEAAVARAASLMDDVASIEIELRLIGLNAQLKCGNLGTRGRSLNVVAQALQSSAKQTQANVSVAGESLRQVTATADRIRVGYGAESLEEVRILKEILDRSVTVLAVAGEETSMVLTEIRTQSQWLVNHINTVTTTFVRDTGATRTISAATDDLSRLAQESRPGLGPADLEEARKGVLAFMQSHYTMASERDVHRRALGHDVTGMLTLTPVAAAAAPDDAEPDLSDIFF